jgi:hypothetical protein
MKFTKSVVTLGLPEGRLPHPARLSCELAAVLSVLTPEAVEGISVLVEGGSFPWDFA